MLGKSSQDCLEYYLEYDLEYYLEDSGWEDSFSQKSYSKYVAATVGVSQNSVSRKLGERYSPPPPFYFMFHSVWDVT